MAGDCSREEGAFEEVPPSRETNETSKLLSDPDQQNLYRTISRRSDIDWLPQDDDDVEQARRDSIAQPDRTSPWGVLSLLLLGVFVSQTDQSLVLATYGKISSEFDNLDSGSWLISAYILAQCAVQPLYGKLSDIYGRKSCLLTAYTLFAIGTLGVGLARSLGEVIAWRVVQGAGGAGMLSMVSIIITDIVPMHEVASLRSYVNILATVGRGAGGVIGGLLTQSLGWRWAFLVQVPPTVLAIGLVALTLHLPPPKYSSEEQDRWTKLKRVDFIGAFFLCLTIVAICLAIDLGGEKIPWNSSPMFCILGGGVAAAIAFVVSATKVPEPIFPLRLATHYVVVTNYLITLFQVMTQMSLMLTVPFYFQATAGASVAVAGAYLIPAFAGNLSGGLLSGIWIKRTGHYKAPTVLAPISALLGFLLLLTTWNGKTSPAQSVFIFPGGFAMGVISSSAFVGLAAGVQTQDIAVTASGMYLFFNVGAIAGVSIGSAVFQSTLRSSFANSLQGVEGGAEIMRKALADINYVQDAGKGIRQLLMPGYVQAFHNVNYFGVICSVLSLSLAFISRGTKLERGK